MQIIQKLTNYQTITNSRKLHIHWGKVLILTKKKQQKKLKNALKAPFNNIQIKTAGEILGKQINISPNGHQSVMGRLKKENMECNKKEIIQLYRNYA